MQGLVDAEGRYVRRLFVLLSVYQEPLALTKLCSKDTLKVRAAAVPPYRAARVPFFAAACCAAWCEV
jgi:hypothetical protein